MIPKYSLIDERDSDGYSAYVPELSSIVMTGSSMDELTARAREAIRICWEELRGGSGWDDSGNWGGLTGLDRPFQPKRGAGDERRPSSLSMSTLTGESRGGSHRGGLRCRDVRSPGGEAARSR